MKFKIVYLFLIFSSVSIAQVTNSVTNSLETEEEVESVEEPELLAVPVPSIRKTASQKKQKKSELTVQQKSIQMNQVKLNLDSQLKMEMNQRESRTPSPQAQNSKNQSVEMLKQIDSNSFEYNYYHYESGNHDVSRKMNIQKAEQLQPNNLDVQEQLAGLNEIEGNVSERNKNIQKMVSEGKIDAQLVEYAYNVVQSCDNNSVLVTHAVEDTYPVLLKNKDKNLEVISLELLQSEAYRDKLKKNGIKLPARETIDVQYFEEFANLNREKNIQYSLTIPKEYLRELEQPIYVQGLTIKNDASNQPENLNKNLELLENRLVKRSILLPKSEKIKKINANYLPMLIQLRDYAKIHQPDKLTEIQKLIDTIISYNKQLKDKVK